MLALIPSTDVNNTITHFFAFIFQISTNRSFEKSTTSVTTLYSIMSTLKIVIEKHEVKINIPLARSPQTRQIFSVRNILVDKNKNEQNVKLSKLLTIPHWINSLETNSLPLAQKNSTTKSDFKKS